jgi:hypothetical protein
MTVNEFITYLQRYVNDGDGNVPVVFAWATKEFTLDVTASEVVDDILVLELDEGE